MSDTAQAEKLRDTCARIREQVARVVVGQDEAVTELMITLLIGGHALLEGPPGVAKTLLAQSLARTLSLTFSRVQFTPDLMPTDLTGAEVLTRQAAGGRQFTFLPGPIFANLVMADEVNRTPAKTQAALLEAMQERQVTVGGKKHPLPSPFCVLATQIPLEQEGTYRLPEAQVDRFTFKILVGYPPPGEEARMIRMTTEAEPEAVEPVLTTADLLAYQRLVARVPAAEQVVRYGLTLVRATRGEVRPLTRLARQWIRMGAGVRTSRDIILGAKARALLAGRAHVAWSDVAAAARPALRHRVVPSFSAESEGITSEDIIEAILKRLPPGA